jgi:hypothetical protein
MKKSLLFSGALLALSVSVASAGGVNFYWNDCLGDGGVIDNSLFACGASSATDHAVGSFALTNPMNDFVAVEVVVDLQAASATLPAWWDFSPSPGACHGTSLSVTFDFSSLGQLSCADPFGTPAQGGIAAYNENGNRARVVGVGAIDALNPQHLSSGTQYYGFELGLKKDKATGAGACAGCSTPVTLVLNSINAVGTGATSQELETSAINNQCITWQGGAGAGVCSAVPTHNRTWGAVKSLYR